jgi:hypothetical protein
MLPPSHPFAYQYIDYSQLSWYICNWLFPFTHIPTEYLHMNVTEVSRLLGEHHLVVLAIEKAMSLENLMRIDFTQSGGATPISYVYRLYTSTDDAACQTLCMKKIDELLIQVLQEGLFDVSALEDEFGLEIDLWPCSPDVRQQCYEVLDAAITHELDTCIVSSARADQLADTALSIKVQERCRVLSDQPYLQELQRGNCTVERIIAIYRRVWTGAAKEEAIRQLLHI